MNKSFRPMKPASITEADLDNLTYPVFVQPKLDGIRCVIKDGVPMTYSLKAIPNKHIRQQLTEFGSLHKHEFFDGELILRDNKATFQQIQSAVMSEEGTPDFIYSIFEYGLSRPYILRLRQLEHFHSNLYPISVLGCEQCSSKEEVLDIEQEILTKGYEGIIIRSPQALYKFGRSTKSEQYLLKLKRFEDAEAVVVGIERLFSNGNEPIINELGLTERSSEGGKLIPRNTMGSLFVKGINGKYEGKYFNVGSGFTAEQREFIWAQAASYIGKTITYKYQEKGSKDLPRMPIFKAFKMEGE